MSKRGAKGRVSWMRTTSATAWAARGPGVLDAPGQLDGLGAAEAEEGGIGVLRARQQARGLERAGLVGDRVEVVDAHAETAVEQAHGGRARDARASVASAGRGHGCLGRVRGGGGLLR